MKKIIEALQQIEMIAIAKCCVCDGECSHDVFFRDIAAIAKNAQHRVQADAAPPTVSNPESQSA